MRDLEKGGREGGKEEGREGGREGGRENKLACKARALGRSGAGAYPGF